MRERLLGSSDLRVSVVGLGCNAFGWRIDASATRDVVNAALEAGITFFDTAESYGEGESELFLGRALAGRRDQVVIGTKFGWGRGHGDNEIARGAPAYVREALEGSLRRLGTDHVELYQYHRPDGVTPIAETLGVLDELRTEGKIRATGSSNMSAAQVREADGVSATQGLARFVSAQNDYSLLERDAERELIPVCEELGLGFIPFFPLARGLLTGKYRHGEEAPEGSRLAGSLELAAETWAALERLEALAARQGASLLELAIGGLAAQPAVASVIAGATSAEQVRLNAAAGEWEPSPEALAELRAL
jgi:aryl-alcohol dehydrogenase-like predicted oxidoreductase